MARSKTSHTPSTTLGSGRIPLVTAERSVASMSVSSAAARIRAWGCEPFRNGRARPDNHERRGRAFSVFPRGARGAAHPSRVRRDRRAASSDLRPEIRAAPRPSAARDRVWPRLMQGSALGFLFVPLTTAALSGISRSGMSNATGLYTLMRQLGGSLGIAILELVQTRREDIAQPIMASSVTLASGPVALMLHGAQSRAAASGRCRKWSCKTRRWPRTIMSSACAVSSSRSRFLRFFCSQNPNARRSGYVRLL